MSAESDLHVVLGASGAIGGAVVRELASQDTVYARSAADATRFTDTFGPFAATPHTEAIAATLGWYRSSGTGTR